MIICHVFVIPRYVFVITRYVLMIPRYVIVITRCPRDNFYIFVITFYVLVITRYVLVITCYVLVITCYVIVITFMFSWSPDMSSWSLLNYHWWKICLNCEYSLDLWLIQGFIISSKIVLNLKQLNWTTETTIESFIEKALNNLKIYYKFMSQFISRKLSISNKNPKNFLIKI